MPQLLIATSSLIALNMLWMMVFSPIQCVSSKKVIVAGATGYIGRAVVRELVSRGIDTYALVRNEMSISEVTKAYIAGANIVECNVLDSEETKSKLHNIQANTIVNCLASRNGLKNDSYSVDYGGGMNLLHALLSPQESIQQSSNHDSKDVSCHYVMLSAFCVGKPTLHFQHAKLKLEQQLQDLSQHKKNPKSLTYSIVRPTAYFKSLDGQVEAAKKGNPILYFGSGNCAANAISEEDLASFLSDCAIHPTSISMDNSIRNVGGPDVPPVTKLEQINLIFDALNIPNSDRKAISLPLSVFSALLFAFSSVEYITRKIGLYKISSKCEDAAEIVKIVQYYATEPMIAINHGEVQGRIRLQDHFCNIAGRGGCLIEIDRYTTTTGVLDLVLKNDYVK